jgi:hypothetical protein
MIFWESANGMFRSHMPIVTTYLHYFYQLHLDFVDTLAGQSRNYSLVKDTIDFWPNQNKTERCWIPLVAYIETKHFKYSSVAGAFVYLEKQVKNRRLVWQLLRDTIEISAAPLTDEDKRNFAKVMSSICVVTNWSIIWRPWIYITYELFMAPTRIGLEYSVPDTGEWPGAPVIEVRNNSLNWILPRGALLVPVDDSSYRLLKNLGNYCWDKVTETSHLEKYSVNYWQMVDMRYERKYSGCC